MDQYLSVILGLEPNQSYAAMLGLVVQFCTAQKETDIIKRYKVNLLYCFFFFFLVISSVTSSWRRGVDRCLNEVGTLHLPLVSLPVSSVVTHF